MLILDRHNRSKKLLDIIATAKKDLSSWHMINVKIMHGSKNKIDTATQKLSDAMGARDGVIFKVEDYKIIVIARYGDVPNHALLKKDIEAQIYALGCRVSTRKITEDLLQSLEVDYVLREGKVDDSLFDARTKRIENTMMVIDDDEFICMAAKEIMKKYGKVYTVEDALQVENFYLKYNPDMILLDIDMPKKDGFSVLNTIMSLDNDAYIVMLSSNSNSKNVLIAVEHGAVGFLTKPIDQEKLLHYLKQCTTMLNIF